MNVIAPQTALPPAIDVDGKEFWEALAKGRLVAPRCHDCCRHSFPSMGSCPFCGSLDVENVELTGKGRLYSWATVEMALSSAFERDVPYTVVVVDLDEGGRMMGRMLGDGVELLAGAEVNLEAYRVGDIVLPGFRMTEGSR
jgi:uncharacterized OB-fold protein